MKNLICLGICFLLIQPCLAQSPYVFNYQGLARDGQGAPLVDQEISVLISVVSGFQEGPIEFQEEHVVTTNKQGIFSLAIGDGDFIFGNLRNLDWGTDAFYIRTEIDPHAGENYIDLGTAQLYSVPFALYALESGSGGSAENQELFFDGENLSISNGNTVDLSTLGSGSQTLSISGDQLSISGGNTVSLPLSNSDPQTLSIVGNQLSISQGNSVTLPSSGGTSLWTIEGNDISYFNGTVGVNQFALQDNGDELITMQSLQSPESGYFSINNKNNPVVELYSDLEADGLIEVYSEQGIPLVALEGLFEPVAGSFSVFGSQGDVLVWGTENIRGNGYLGLYDPDGNELIQMSSRSLTSFGPNNATNCRVASLSSNQNHGYITVDDASGNDRAGMYVNNSGQGIVYADITAAVSNDPIRSDQQIVYAALSGPEAAAYMRGTATLVNGRAQIRLPAHFRNMVNTKTMTIMMTPYSIESKGLAVVHKDDTGFEVGELFTGTGTYDFDWEVKAIRKGHENYQVMQTERKPIIVERSREKQ